MNYTQAQREQRKQDKRLRDAAPALLEALIDMVSAHPPPTRGAFKGYVSPELQKALDAIQKATQP
jgi:hypothetical protein